MNDMLDNNTSNDTKSYSNKLILFLKNLTRVTDFKEESLFLIKNTIPLVIIKQIII